MDTAAAFQIAQVMFTSVFEIRSSGRLKVRISNHSLYDELIGQ
jgi:hypothetical protein